MMKVLWLANTPCEAIDYLSGEIIKSGGWLYALCQQLKIISEVELHVAFISGHTMASFEYKGVGYHPIWRKGNDSRIGRYLNRHVNPIARRNELNEKYQCLQIIRDIKPDIIHIQGSEEFFGLITQSDEITMPVVLSIQGVQNACCQKFYSGISRKELTSGETIFSKVLRNGFDEQFKVLNQRAERERIIFKTMRYVIGRTSMDRRCALALNPQTQYFTVDEILREEFMSAIWEMHEPHECFNIVTTISSGLYKGLEVIYQTAQLLTNLQFPFRWKVIGLASSDKIVRMTERLYKLCANDIHIELLGVKTAQDIVNIMQCSDIYIQVSHIENSPNSLCEAMALGMPIIASNVGGTSSMLKDGTEGILLQDGNQYELAGAIIEAKRHYSKAVAMGENARIRAQERHNPTNVIRELLRVYQQLIMSK